MLGFWIEMSHLVLQDNKNALEVDQTDPRLSVCVSDSSLEKLHCELLRL